MRIAMNPFGLLARLPSYDEGDDFLTRMKKGEQSLYLTFTHRERLAFLSWVMFGGNRAEVVFELIRQLNARTRPVPSEEARSAVREIRFGVADYLLLGLPAAFRIVFHSCREKYNAVSALSEGHLNRFLKGVLGGLMLVFGTVSFALETVRALIGGLLMLPVFLGMTLASVIAKKKMSQADALNLNDSSGGEVSVPSKIEERSQACTLNCDSPAMLLPFGSAYLNSRDRSTRDDDSQLLSPEPGSFQIGGRASGA